MCHVYVAASASVNDACLAVVDSKVDYPSVCNAMETLLLHTDTLCNGVARNVLMHLLSHGTNKTIMSIEHTYDNLVLVHWKL